jgi:hypothetical protein
MVGFITERHLQQADEAFPGIAGFFATLSPKPRTFLDLVLAFQRREKFGWPGDNRGWSDQDGLFREERHARVHPYTSHPGHHPGGVL